MERESIRDYNTILRKMTSTSSFGAFLSTALRNQFTCRVKDQRIKSRLLEVKKLTLEIGLSIVIPQRCPINKNNKTAFVSDKSVKKQRRTTLAKNL